MIKRIIWGGSVRSRLLFLMALTAVPSLAATGYLFAVERRAAVERTEAELTRLVTEATVEHEALLRLGGRVLQAAALMDDVVSGSRAACEADLAGLAAATPEIVNPTRTSIAGFIDCVPGREAGADVRDNPRFTEGIASDSIVVGPYLRSVSLPEAIVPLNLRLVDRTGRPTGLLSVGVRMGWFQDLAARLDLPDGSVISLMDGSGLVLARIPDDGIVGQRFPDAQFTRLLNSGQRSGSVDGRGVDGVFRRVAFAALQAPPDAPVAVAIAVPHRTIVADANRALVLRLALISAALLLTWAIVTGLARPILLGDLERLDAAADRIGTGDFTVRSGVEGAPVELQRLADTFDDMAERLAAREERQLQAQKLESLGRLAGGVAHDFNNMLTAVMGNVEDVRDGLPEGSDARKRLDAALEAARRSGQLTFQLLAFARREGVMVSPLALRPVLEDTAQLMRRTLGPDVTLVVEAADGLVIAADRARLEQALVNLALNARDAMPSGGTLRLQARAVRADELPFDALPDAAAAPGGGEWVRVDVQDSGVGMPPEVRARVFEPFFTTKPTGKGTGLGLAMVYATMQQFGGTATVDSTVGRGTTVSLWLPRSDASPVAERRHTPTATVAVGPARILLVDDETPVRVVSARALRRAGYVVVEAGDGIEGLRILEGGSEAPFDLVISDVRMPRMGGVEFGEAVRQRSPDVPMLFLSGFQGDERLEPLLATPRTTLLLKPFRAADLLAAAAGLLSPSTTPG